MRRPLILALALLLANPVFAAETTDTDNTQFVVRHIDVEGLQRISNNTVMAAMPLHVGQTYTTETGNAVIAALFRTGFFSDVQLVRKDDTLIVSVLERPTIDSVTLT